MSSGATSLSLGHWGVDMDLASELQDVVQRYLAKQLDLRGLEDWIVSHWGDLLPPSSASELAGILELGLAEMSSGHLSETEFRELIAQFFRPTIAITSGAHEPSGPASGE